MRRFAVLLSVIALFAACGSEQEKSASAPASQPAADPSARSAAYDQCASKIAVGSSDGAEISEEARKALREYREALKSDDAEVRCASDVDSFGDGGWTQYAPLPDDSAEGTASAWVGAINASDWAEVCELSVSPEDGCEGIVEELFSPVAGKVEIEGFYEAQGQTTFALNVPEGFEPSVERHRGRYLVHFEYAVIR